MALCWPAELLTDMEEKSPAFHEFLRELTSQAAQSKGQNLYSSLILPVQVIITLASLVSNYVGYEGFGAFTHIFLHPCSGLYSVFLVMR